MAEPSQRPRVNVIVLSWNRREDLRHCLDALAAQTYVEREVVVVDNGSADGSAEMVRGEYPAARLMRSETNLGFAAGNNLAIRATDAPYIATLNNDALAEPEWLATLVAAAEADPKLGSVASKMVFQQDPTTINSCGIALDRAGIAWDLWGGYPAGLIDGQREVFGPCAGAALYRRAMLDDVGLFDEDYFAYLEDVDLAWRARLRGWRCVLQPDAVVRHAHSGTLGEGSPLKRYLLARNKVWTIAKCAPTSRLLTDLPVAALYDVGAVSFAVARHRDWASLRGRLAGLAGLPRALRKRSEIQARRVVDGRDLESFYAPLAAPWDVPRRYRHLLELGGQAVGVRGWGAEGTASGDRIAVPGGAPGARGKAPTMRVVFRRWLLKGLGLVLRAPARPRTRTLESNPQPSSSTRVVVLRPDHLGDVLLSRPAIRALVGLGPIAHGARRRVSASPQPTPDPRLPTPDVDVDVAIIAGPWGAASLQGLPVRVVAFPFPGFTRAPKGGPLAPYTALLAFAAHLRRERYDAAVILRPDHWWGALATALAGIPIRVGDARPDTAPFLTHAIQGNRVEHATKAALRAVDALADALGLERPATRDVGVRFHPSAGADAAADVWIRDNLGDRRPIVMLHPGAGAAVKTWPSRRWARVADEIVPEAAVVLTGGAADAELMAGIQAASANSLRNAPNMCWDELAALYSRAAVVIGMDSGPLHLAAAVGTPTVRVYGPTDPRIYGPAEPSEGHHVLAGTLACVPCGDLVAPPCGYLQDPPCLASVDPGSVVAATLAALRVPAAI